MDDVVDIERDFRRAKQGETLIYTTLHGLKTDLSQPATTPTLLSENIKVETNQEENNIKESSSEEDETSEEEEDDDESGEDGEEDEANKSANDKYFRPRDESPNSRKVAIIFKRMLLI